MGLPESRPLGESVSPVGSGPPADQTYGGVPPVAVSWRANALPTCDTTVSLLVMPNGALTITVNSAEPV